MREHAITAVRHGQETTLTVIKHVTEAVSAASAKLPGVPEGLRGPLADKLPSREAVAAGLHDFAAQLVAEQRKFADEVLKITASLRASATGEAAAEGTAKDEGAAKDAAEARDTAEASDSAEAGDSAPAEIAAKADDASAPAEPAE
jgi:hypothetical protein